MIYIHIPFCKQACHYCDFHFSTSLKYKNEMLQAIETELEIRSSYLPNKKIDSIYFGGGTPSILNTKEIQRIIDKITTIYDLNSDSEITLEANPDDLNEMKVKSLRSTNINRFSIGIQSFHEEDLQWMNRAHNAQEADSSIKRVQDAGFENITCDLIYGFPLLSNEKWISNIQKLIDLNVPHISSYNMTVESRTALDHFIKKGSSPALSEGQGEEQMLILMDKLNLNGYEHYEISNFAKSKKYAIHNTNYWLGKHYLGIGPSAHSFNGKTRSWNISNNAKYLEGISEGTPILETESLSQLDRYNEYTMTSLRTIWGINIRTIEKDFGNDFALHMIKSLRKYQSSNHIEQVEENIYRLTKKGKLMADYIASDLFITED